MFEGEEEGTEPRMAELCKDILVAPDKPKVFDLHVRSNLNHPDLMNAASPFMHEAQGFNVNHC